MFAEAQKNEDTGKLCRIYGAVDSRFVYEEQDCDEGEKYACFADGKLVRLSRKVEDR